MMHRPGPAAIEPGGAPGGLVFQVYDREDRLVATDRIEPPNWQPSSETIESAVAAEEVCLVVYDGDTGRRWTDEDFQHIGFRSGQHLS